jgi:hypothetical protein
MRYHSDTDDETARLNAEPWQLALLKANPGYCSWGPHEDYMWTKGDGWNSAQIFPTWADFGPWNLDDLNECVNFYFEVNRASTDCTTCGGNGYHPKAQEVQGTFYEHMCDERGLPRSRAWHDKITDDEAQALIDAGRRKPGETAASINAANAPGARGFDMHDAINRSILVEARCKRLGLPLTCPTCEGHGYTYTEPAAHVSLVLWWLHPRKGCSRGIEVTRIARDELPAVQKFLAAAAERNAARFSGVGLIA